MVEEQNWLMIMSSGQCVPVVALGRTVPGAAAASTMAPVTQSMAPVSVIQDGLAGTAPSVCFLTCFPH